MTKSKQNTPAITQLTPTTPQRVTPDVTQAAEHFAGRRDSDGIYKVAGCRLDLEAVLVRTYRADPYRLLVNLGDEWMEIASVRADDPALAELPIVEYGPSPAEIEKQRWKEEQERKRIEAEEAQKEERRQAIIEQKERARALRRPDLAN